MNLLNHIFKYKKYQPKCKYPTTCTRRDCTFEHTTVPDCKFGERCFHKHVCRFIHRPVKRVYPPRNVDFPKIINGSPTKRSKLDFRKAVVSCHSGVYHIVNNNLETMVKEYDRIKDNKEISKIVFRFL